MEGIQKYLNRQLRAFVVTIPESVAKIEALNGSDPLLGETAAFAVLLGGMQKQETTVSVTLKLKEKTVYATVRIPQNTVCGRLETKENDEIGLTVSLSYPHRHGYTGTVTGETPEAMFSAYFTDSQQILSSYRIFRSDGCVSVLFQEALPNQFPTFSDTLPDDAVPTEVLPFSYGCTCTRAGILRLLRQMDSSTGTVRTFCNACGKKYVFEL